jgi:hypothetical protein
MQNLLAEAIGNSHLPSTQNWKSLKCYKPSTREVQLWCITRLLVSGSQILYSLEDYGGHETLKTSNQIHHSSWKIIQI